MNHIDAGAGRFLRVSSLRDGPLDIREETLSNYQDLFKSGDDNIPFELVLQSAMSFTYDSAFMALYRCIEQFYSEPLVSKLSAEWRLSKSLFDVARDLEDWLGWRPREEDSLAKILERVEYNRLHSLGKILCKDVSSDKLTSQAIVKALYRLRNDCVHFRPFRGRALLNAGDWCDLIDFMLHLIDNLYREKAGLFFGVGLGEQAHT